MKLSWRRRHCQGLETRTEMGRWGFPRKPWREGDGDSGGFYTLRVILLASSCTHPPSIKLQNEREPPKTSLTYIKVTLLSFFIYFFFFYFYSRIYLLVFGHSCISLWYGYWKKAEHKNKRTKKLKKTSLELLEVAIVDRVLKLANNFWNDVVCKLAKRKFFGRQDSRTRHSHFLKNFCYKIRWNG